MQYGYDNFISCHFSVLIDDKGKIVKLFDTSDYSNYITIFNFHTGVKLNKIKVDCRSYALCLWSNNIIITSIKNSIIFLVGDKYMIPFKKENILLSTIHCIKKFNHPIKGECLIFKDEDKMKIKYLYIQ